jgi:hypothetical protein
MGSRNGTCQTDIHEFIYELDGWFFCSNILHFNHRDAFDAADSSHYEH